MDRKNLGILNRRWHKYAQLHRVAVAKNHIHAMKFSISQLSDLSP